MRFPFGPLGRLLVGMNDREQARRLGVTTRTLYRWRVEGLTLFAADGAAVVVGLHPLLVWPEWAEIGES